LELWKGVAVTPDRSPLSRLALQGLIGLLVTLCIGAAAMARREPQLYLASPVADSQSFAQPASASRAPGGQLPPPAQTLLADSAPSPAPSPEQEKLGQLFRGFLAVVEQEIEELKTSIEQLKTGQEQMVRNNSALSEQIKAAQEQIARDNAVIAEQLRATQEQLSRLFAKTSEQQPRPKTSAPLPRSIATSAGKPVPKPSSSQTRAQPARGRSEKQ
jgi:outer membrane murein-binding lipoprotein Lpp